MAAPTEAFGVTVKADFRDFEKALLRAQNQTDTKLAAMERRFDRSNRAVRQQTAGLATAAKAGLDDLAANIGMAGDGLPGLGAGMGKLGIAGAAAAVGVGSLVMALRGVQDAARFAADLTDVADRIGIGVEALQELRYAADETGVPLSNLDSALEALNGTLGAFKTGIGAGRIKPVFETLGITPHDLQNVHTANDLLPLLADRLGKISDRATQVQLAKKLGIESLLPLLRQGSDGLERMAKEGRDLGLVLSGEVVSGLDEADRALERSQQQIDANVRSMQATLAPFFTWITGAVANAMRMIGNLLSVSETERLQNAINLRARIERGQRANGRPLDARTQGIYDRAGREAEDVLAARRSREARAAENAANPDSGGFVPDIAGSSGGRSGGVVRTSSGDSADRDALQRDRRFDDAMAELERERLMSLSQLATTTQQRASIAITMLDMERQARRVELDRQVTDGEITEAQRAQLLAAEEAVWLNREANIAAMVDNEALDKARDQLLSAIRQEVAEQETARQAYERAKEDFQRDFVDGVRSALDGELDDYFANLADRFANRLLENMADDLFDQLSGKGAGGWPTSFGKFLGFADGGMVRGTGSGTSDSIPARLSNGEFVVNAKATKKARALLEAINSGRFEYSFARGGMVTTGSNGPPAQHLDLSCPL